MAFWGIEIKPSKPYTHNHDSTRGRLRISQVTLGNGKSGEKVTLQCNVGNKSPILLCRLTPDVSETCHLELEFEEDDDVVFSVLGQRSVHLSGYFIGLGRDTGGNETDSYGEDIAHSDSDDSNFYASFSEDEYESDFIDDDDIEMLPASPRPKSGVVIEEIDDDEKPTNGNGNRRRLKKKNQVVDSDEGNVESQRQLVKGSSAIVDSEDEDGFPISVSLKNKDVDSIAENAKSDATIDEDRKRKICVILDDPESKKALDASSQPESGDLSGEKPKKKKKLKDRKPVEKGIISEVKSEEESKEEPSGAANNGNMDEDSPSSVVPDNDKVEVDHSAPATSVKMKKKNKKKKLKDVTVREVVDSDREGDNVDTTDGEQKKSEDTDREGDNVDTTDGEQKKSADSDQELPKDESHEQEAKKKRKKKKKNKNVVKDTNDQSAEVKVAEGGMDDPKPSKAREFPNGLIMEDVSMGKPDGKRAIPGSKVLVHYTGKLKKNGKIFDASRRKPFGFRLGIGEVIKGWDVGVNGMRVGDKRRLTIPPSMGYGNKNTGEIPANSWLVFDVELVDVK